MKKVFIRVVKIAMVFSLCSFGALQGVSIGFRQLHAVGVNVWVGICQRLTRVEIVREYLPRDEKTLGAIIKEAAADYRLPPFIISAMIEQESGKGLRPDRVRFEPEVFKRVKRMDWMTEEEQRLQASSLGLMQVIPYFHSTESAQECRIGLREFFDPELNVRCGCAIMRRCLDRNSKVQDKVQRFLLCLEQYNGGKNYPGEVKERMVRQMLEASL